MSNKSIDTNCVCMDTIPCPCSGSEGLKRQKKTGDDSGKPVLILNVSHAEGLPRWPVSSRGYRFYFALVRVDPEKSFLTPMAVASSPNPVWDTRLSIPLSQLALCRGYLTLDVFRFWPANEPGPSDDKTFIGWTRIPVPECPRVRTGGWYILKREVKPGVVQEEGRIWVQSCRYGGDHSDERGR